MNIKQFQISSLKPLYDDYPDMRLGDIIGVTINPNNRNEVLVDFKYNDDKARKLVQDVEFNISWREIRQNGIYEIKKRQADILSEIDKRKSDIELHIVDIIGGVKMDTDKKKIEDPNLNTMTYLKLVGKEDVMTNRKQKREKTTGSVVNTVMVDKYEKLYVDDKFKLEQKELFASEVNYVGLSIPDDEENDVILDKWRGKDIIYVDLRTGLRKYCRLRKEQQYWITGLSDFWAQYSYLADIAIAHKHTGEKNVVYSHNDKVDLAELEMKTGQVISVSGKKCQVMDVRTYEVEEVEIPEGIEVAPERSVQYVNYGGKTTAINVFK